MRLCFGAVYQGFSSVDKQARSTSSNSFKSIEVQNQRICHGNLALGKVYRTTQYTDLLQVHAPHSTTLALVTAETERQL